MRTTLLSGYRSICANYLGLAAYLEGIDRNARHLHIFQATNDADVSYDQSTLFSHAQTLQDGLSDVLARLSVYSGALQVSLMEHRSSVVTILPVGYLGIDPPNMSIV